MDKIQLFNKIIEAAEKNADNLVDLLRIAIEQEDEKEEEEEAPQETVPLHMHLSLINLYIARSRELEYLLREAANLLEAAEPFVKYGSPVLGHFPRAQYQEWVQKYYDVVEGRHGPPIVIVEKPGEEAEQAKE